MIEKLTFIGKYVRRQLLEMSNVINLSDMEMLACVFIYYHWETNQERIARALYMDSGNMAKLMSSLECGGVISRKVNPRNRREYLIELTDGGRDRIKLVIDAVKEYEDRMLEELTVSEREVFLGALDKIFVKLSEGQATAEKIPQSAR